MRFDKQVSATARIGIRMFGVSVLLLTLSRVVAFFNSGMLLGVAKWLFFLGLFLMASAILRSFAKHSQRKFEKNGWTHPFSTVGPMNRWYYWVDKNGKDRDA